MGRQGGRARVLRGATVTALGYPGATVGCVQAKGMKEPGCLATRTTDKRARELINLYGKRWGIEPGFRDSKDIRFGMGMGEGHVSTPDRRDRLWLINAFAVALLTLLGAAGEALGYDRISSPTPPSDALTRCFARGSCSTNSSLPGRNTGYGPGSRASPKCLPRSRSSSRRLV